MTICVVGILIFAVWRRGNALHSTQSIEMEWRHVRTEADEDEDV